MAVIKFNDSNHFQLAGLKILLRLVNNKQQCSKLNYTVMEVRNEEEEFFPHGAIVFFVLLITLCLVIWYGIYFLMLSRT